MTDARPFAVRLAEYVARETTVFPEHVLARARLGVIDTLGCMVGASRMEPGRLVTSYVAERGASGSSTVISIANRVRAEDAGLANGTLAHMLELDDGHRPSDNHLGCVIVPSALAVAEELGSTAGEMLDAIVIGYDVMGRVGEAVLLPRRKSPFHGTGTTGVFGAAAVAARLLRLGVERTSHALGIAGTAAAGLRESTDSGPDCKPLHAGRAAQNGIQAAFLAASGYRGPTRIFEGRNGFCAAMSDEPRPELITDALGERFAIVESGFKVHSTCGMLFTLLDGILEARTKLDLSAANAPSAIRIAVPTWLLTEPAFMRRRPATAAEARFSIPFAVAAAIADGRVSPAQMTDEKLAAAGLETLEHRVEIVTDREVDAIFEATRSDPFFFYPAAVEIDYEGRTHRTLHRSPRGYDPQQPLTKAEVVQKFRTTVAGVLDDQTSGQIVEQVLGWTADDDIRVVTRLTSARIRMPAHAGAGR